jgi:ATP-dependent RNA helicase DDX41
VNTGKTGIATTFINRNCADQILLDLKHLLIEAKQRVPPVLAAMEDPNESLYKFQQATATAPDGSGENRGCAFCGGLGHRLADCPKFLAQKKKELGIVRSHTVED